MPSTHAAAPPGAHATESSATRQLIREDVFDRLLDDAELDRLVAERARTSVEPYADLLRLLLGMSLPEEEARLTFERVVEHRRELSSALGRPVHVRVAALDLLTSRPESPATRASRPIMMAPAMLERALEEAGADGVTGLPRRPFFVDLLEHELLQRARRVVVGFVDLDGFKRVNDEHGHARGDEILRTMADAARIALRRGDVVARLGGDEFGLLLVDASADEAQAAIDRLRSTFEELTAPFGASFSAGLAIAEAGATAEELLRIADEAMYAEKRRRAIGRR
jgi:diguanylate cyclase (GGDEF)-like protein